MTNYEKYGFCPFSKQLTKSDCGIICFCDDCDTFFKGYNKAIDDFLEKIKSNDRLGYVGCLDKIVDEIAEQLKEGVVK